MSLIDENSYVIMNLLTPASLLEYRVNINGEIESTQKTDIDLQLESYCRLESNDNFVAFSVSEITFLIGRQQFKSSIYSKRFTSLRSFELIQTNNIVFFFDDHAENYKLQLPQISIHPSTTTSQNYNVSIIATSVEFDQIVQCQFTLMSIYVSEDQSQGIQYTGRPFDFKNQSMIDGDYTYKISLGDNIVGPNIQYTVYALNNKGDNDIQDFSYSIQGPQIEFVTIDTQDWSNIIFTQIRVVSDQQFYLLMQDSKYNVRIYSCQISKSDDKFIDCGSQPQGQMSLGGKINIWSFVLWYKEECWLIVDQYNGIYINDFYGYSIAYFSPYETQYTILDLKVSGTQIFILYENYTHDLNVDFRSFDIDFQLFAQINKNTFQNMPYSGQNWNPQSILASETLPSTVVIQLSTNDNSYYLVAAKINNHVINQLYSTQFSEPFTAQIFMRKLLLNFYQSSRTAEYDMSQLYSLQLEKVLPTYSSTASRLYQPILTRGGNIYQLLQDESKMNIYDMQQPMFNTLMYQWTQTGKQEGEKNYQFYISVDGGKLTDVLLTISNGVLSLYLIPKFQQISIVASIPKTTYLEVSDFQLISTSWDSTIQILSSYEINAVNEETRPQMNHTFIAQSGVQNDLYIPSTPNPATYTLDDAQWCKGSIFRYNLTCQNASDCGQQIILTNKLEEIMSDVGYISDAVDFNFDKNTDHIFILSTTQIYIFDGSFKLVTLPIQLGIDPSVYKCEQFVQGRDYQQNLKYQHVFCKNISDPTNAHYALIPVDVSQLDPVVSAPIEMNDIHTLGKTLQFYNLNDQIILINELSVGAIYMYKLDYSAVELSLLYVFDTTYFSASPASMLVTFQILQTSPDDICILFVDQLMRMYALNVKNIASKTFITFDTKSWFQINNLYFTNQTYIKDLALWQLQLDQDNDLIANMLVITSNTPLYDMIMTVPAAGSSISAQLYAMYNNYGSGYHPQGSLQTLGQQFGIIYSNIESNSSIIAIYQQYKSVKKENDDGIVTLSQFNAAFWYQNIPANNASYHFSFFTGSSGQVELLSVNPLNGEIDQISYQKYMTFSILSNSVNPQNVTFTAINDNTEPTDSFVSALTQNQQEDIIYIEQ
eukprot:TRINITY_DN4383_c0_g1_i1.p1 TRINITY_DN4383_c0_g1~~TRINITY_DN4383_c0_g1_i1.p1  ORF type:complete len:1106 (-),score=173.52 TRINITY_DN4383_c0_g1_i1:100-3417(-)